MQARQVRWASPLVAAPQNLASPALAVRHYSPKKGREGKLLGIFPSLSSLIANSSKAINWQAGHYWGLMISGKRQPSTLPPRPDDTQQGWQGSGVVAGWGAGERDIDFCGKVACTGDRWGRFRGRVQVPWFPATAVFSEGLTDTFLFLLSVPTILFFVVSLNGCCMISYYFAFSFVDFLSLVYSQRAWPKIMFSFLCRPQCLCY